MSEAAVEKPIGQRAPLTPEQVDRAKMQNEIDQARMDTYDEAIFQVSQTLNQLQRIRDQVEASASARAKLVADWPKADETQPPIWVPARAVDRDWTLWQHHCGRIVPNKHEPTSDACGRCGDVPVLPGDWHQLYVRSGGLGESDE